MNYLTLGGRKISAIMIGKELKDYPSWVHTARMSNKLTFETIVEDEKVIVTKIKIKNIYGGTDIGLRDKDYICRGVAKELFICRKAIFDFLYTKDNKK